jgi:hypothetical protein
VQSLVDASKGAEAWRKQHVKVSRACYPCGEEGHRAVDFPKGPSKHGEVDLWAGRGHTRPATTDGGGTAGGGQGFGGQGGLGGETRGGAGIRVGRQQSDGDVLKKFRGKVDDVASFSAYLCCSHGTVCACVRMCVCVCVGGGGGRQPTLASQPLARARGSDFMVVRSGP